MISLMKFQIISGPQFLRTVFALELADLMHPFVYLEGVVIPESFPTILALVTFICGVGHPFVLQKFLFCVKHQTTRGTRVLGTFIMHLSEVRP